MTPMSLPELRKASLAIMLSVESRDSSRAAVKLKGRVTIMAKYTPPMETIHGQPSGAKATATAKAAPTDAAVTIGAPLRRLASEYRAVTRAAAEPPRPKTAPSLSVSCRASTFGTRTVIECWGRGRSVPSSARSIVGLHTVRGTEDQSPARRHGS